MAMGLLPAGVDRAVIALLAGPRIGGDHTDLPRSEPRNEGGDSGKDIATQRQAWPLSAG
jgi:hypothetical protein